MLNKYKKENDENLLREFFFDCDYHCETSTDEHGIKQDGSITNKNIHSEKKHFDVNNDSRQVSVALAHESNNSHQPREEALNALSRLNWSPASGMPLLKTQVNSIKEKFMRDGGFSKEHWDELYHEFHNSKESAKHNGGHKFGGGVRQKKTKRKRRTKKKRRTKRKK